MIKAELFIQRAQLKVRPIFIIASARGIRNRFPILLLFLGKIIRKFGIVLGGIKEKAAPAAYTVGTAFKFLVFLLNTDSIENLSLRMVTVSIVGCLRILL